MTHSKKKHVKSDSLEPALLSMTQQKTNTSRLVRVLRLRDAALEIIRCEGKWEEFGRAGKVLCARIGDIQMIYRTPFQKMPEIGITDSQRHCLATNGIKMTRQLPYGLDIWVTRKVMNLEWDHRGKPDLVSFKPGDWEADLLEASRRP